MRVWAYSDREDVMRFFCTEGQAITAKAADDMRPASVFDQPTTKVSEINFKTKKQLVDFLNHYAA